MDSNAAVCSRLGSRRKRSTRSTNTRTALFFTEAAKAALEYADAITDTVRDVDDEGLYRTGAAPRKSGGSPPEGKNRYRMSLVTDVLFLRREANGTPKDTVMRTENRGFRFLALYRFTQPRAAWHYPTSPLPSCAGSLVRPSMPTVSAHPFPMLVSHRDQQQVRIHMLHPMRTLETRRSADRHGQSGRRAMSARIPAMPSP